ncbi:MAG: hypothetical protein LCH76_10100 [Actinobacteria bacterium]|nr:hypothetical protein [Actinomycetota bacterium]
MRRWLRRVGWDAIRDTPIFTSSRQAECLDAALVSTEPPLLGALAGLDDITGLPVTGDPHRMYRHERRLIGSPNVCVFGGVDMAKSTTVKNQYVIRPWALGTRCAVFDRKVQRAGAGQAEEDGVGEYATVAAALEGEWLRFDRRPGRGACINILDPAITVTGSENTLVGQDELLLMVAQEATGGPLIDSADYAPHYALRCAHRTALRRAAKEGRVAILPDVVEALYRPDPADIPGPVDDAGRKIVSELGLVDERTLVRWGLGLAMNLDRFITGDLSGLIDGETRNADGGPINLDNRLLVIDTSALSEGSPALGLVMAIMSSFIMARWARMPGDKILVLEEAYNAENLVGVPAIFRAIAKRGRGVGAAVVTVLHHLSDIDPESDLWSLIRECELVHIFRQDKADDAEQAIRLYNLPVWLRESMMTLDRGVCIFIRGSKLPRILLRHQRTEFETILNNTEAGMGARAEPLHAPGPPCLPASGREGPELNVLRTSLSHDS